MADLKKKQKVMSIRPIKWKLKVNLVKKTLLSIVVFVKLSPQNGKKPFHSDVFQHHMVSN